MHCIIPPYMVEKIESAGETRRSLFASSVHTGFNDELFRKKRAVLTEMNDKQMKNVLNTATVGLMNTVASGRSGAAAVKPGPKKERFMTQKIMKTRESCLVN